MSPSRPCCACCSGGATRSPGSCSRRPRPTRIRCTRGSGSAAWSAARSGGSPPPTTPRWRAPAAPRAERPAAPLLSRAPPDPPRLRRLVTGASSPKTIAGLEPWIREVTVRLLAATDGATGFDLIDALAFPLPIAVICQLLGVPAGDQAQFRAWGHDVAATLDPQTAAAAQADTRAAEVALNGYLQDLVRQRRARPDDSILSAVIAAEDEGDG